MVDRQQAMGRGTVTAPQEFTKAESQETVASCRADHYRSARYVGTIPLTGISSVAIDRGGSDNSGTFSRVQFGRQKIGRGQTTAGLSGWSHQRSG